MKDSSIKQVDRKNRIPGLADFEVGKNSEEGEQFLDNLANAIIIVAEELAKAELYGNMDIHGNKAK